MNRSFFGLTFAVAAPLFVLSAGCEKDSAELETKNIEAVFTVELDDAIQSKPVMKVGARLRESESSAVGPQGGVNLSGTDTLSVKTDKNQDLPLARVSDGQYEATGADIAATTFTFDLKRGDVSTTTPFTFQAPLAFTDSPAGKSFGAGDTVRFAWSNPAKSSDLRPAKLTVTASSYPCGGAAVNLSAKDEIPFDDTGSFEVTVARLYNGDTPKAGDCVNIAIKRRVVASANSALDKASNVAGTRTDRVQIKIN